MLARNSIVATVGSELAGFSDVGPEGYVDMLFVSPRHQRRGVARQLLAHVEAKARSQGTASLSADVSITARTFFELHGFTVEAEQFPVKAGVELTNYKMRKGLRERTQHEPMLFAETELAYLASQRPERLATTQPDGTLQVSQVGFSRSKPSPH
jgi:GNAT superfamily N-acetyltransferase